MRKRTRFISGLFVLVAMVLSLAEAAWASTCAPAMEMSASTATAEHAAMDHMPEGDCMPGQDHSHEHESGPFCPLGTASMTQGCAAAASLPAHVAVDLSTSPEAESMLFSSEREPHLLFGVALFRPPRA